MIDHPFVKCLDPQRIYNKYSREFMVVPCNHCTACCLRSSSRLADKCRFEGLTAAKVFFVTLTFANTYVPRARLVKRGFDEWEIYDADSGEYLDTVVYDSALTAEFIRQAHLFGYFPYLKWKMVQDFIKRVRDRFAYGTLRYFACGEYGPDRFRPHFHILFYVSDTSEVMRISEHPLGYFPRWTWPEKPGRVYTPADMLTYLEFACRDCWKFGRVDFEIVGGSSCSSYVADYVNGSQPVPPFLEVPATRSRCSHSRFLGRAFFAKEFIQSVESSPDDVVSAYVPRSGGFRKERLPSYHYSAFFPKCKGYSYSSRSSRAFRYRLLQDCYERYGKDHSVMDLARFVIGDIYSQIVQLGRTSCGCPMVDYFYQSSGYADLDFDSPDDVEHCLYNVYRELLVSKRFFSNCELLYDHFCDLYPALSFDAGDIEQFYLTCIDNFYSRIDLLNLNLWYSMMQDYYSKKPLSDRVLCNDDEDDPDLVYFYNNTDYDMDKYKYSLPYKRFRALVSAQARERVKHKQQNAKNLKYLQDE